MNEPSDDLSQIVVTSLREGRFGYTTVTYESDDDRIELKHTIKTAGHWLGAVVAAGSSAAKRVSIDGRPAGNKRYRTWKKSRLSPQQMGGIHLAKYFIHPLVRPLDRQLVALLGSQ